MITGFDHVIIGVNDLEQATEVFQKRLGLAVSGGGTHPFGGTANRIIVIGETYLELITVQKPAEAQQSMLDLLAQGDGYFNCVFASDAIEADSEAIRTRGYQIIGPNPGELRSGSGRTRGWIRTDVERPDLAQRYPFLIQHDSSGEERRSRLAGWQAPPSHPLGARSVFSTTLAVQHLADASHRFQQIYAFPAPAHTSSEPIWPDVTLHSFPLGTGEQFFELASPHSALSQGREDVAEEQIIQQRIEHQVQRCVEERGEYLCRMTLTVEDLTQARHYLERQNVHYLYETSSRPAIWIDPQDSCGALIVLIQH
ncbi:VOC family protein [Tengunoibacter tsumagoiensis]|uniref:VOC domain-containing protein n=1 Tax=Tengunoibacter tsumagoiensis TaxID=2014871 RepID=A0A401ZXI0_9CHLR|nr:VOC family protein [Tengunoibacter tsumagoiensis]GCE11551.1 hypothetical protein KTT_14100 [Tengunoibacter tsumagoiensis]